ncbi:MAG: ATP-binding cassette domain-containing protein [Spirochaetota bacterium]|nr:ATP-binding cassette domain-containing protein [Spirochaetota bacterium]
MLEARDLVKRFASKRSFFRAPDSFVHAVDGVSFALQARESLGLVGESGSGKTTIGRCIVRMEKPDAGSIVFDTTDIAGLDSKSLLPFRRRMQYVFQDPYSALNPRMKVSTIVGEALAAHTHMRKAEIMERVEGVLLSVGLDASAFSRYPHEFSGGQRQRIAIARALILDPELLVLDEPVSALDVSIQAQILNLLSDIRATRALACIIISHDLAVIREVSDRTAVLYLGRIVEYGSTESVFANARHPYTQSLIDAIPDLDSAMRGTPQGEPPSNIRPPTGCGFHPRCPRMQKGVCDRERPVLSGSDAHLAACHAQG